MWWASQRVKVSLIAVTELDEDAAAQRHNRGSSIEAPVVCPWRR